MVKTDKDFGAYKCTECRNPFSLPMFCTREQYAYKLNDGHRYRLFCSWSCLCKAKRKKAAAKATATKRKPTNHI